MKFYRERNGDYLRIDPKSAVYYRKIGQPRIREGRATCIAGNINSVNTTGISTLFLKGCRKVRREDVPQEWLRSLVGEE